MSQSVHVYDHESGQWAFLACFTAESHPPAGAICPMFHFELLLPSSSWVFKVTPPPKQHFGLEKHPAHEVQDSGFRVCGLGFKACLRTRPWRPSTAKIYASSPILSGRLSVATTASKQRLPKTGHDTASAGHPSSSLFWGVGRA